MVCGVFDVKKKDVELEDLPGVGRITLEKLKEAGIVSVKHVALLTPEELAQLAGIEPDKAARIISAATEALQLDTARTARAVAETKYETIKTYVAEFDEKAGGFKMGRVVETAGEFGAGKSMFAHQLSVAAVQQLRCDVVYIDAEGTFNFPLVEKLERRLGVDAADRITVYNPATAYQLEHIVKHKLVRHVETGARLVVVDTITALYRAEYPGRENLAARQQRIHYVVDILRRYSKIYGIGVLLTNQVMDVPDIFASKRPAGGNVLAHAVHERYFFVRPNKTKPEGYIWPLDVPGLSPDVKMAYRITDAGLE